MRTKQPLFNAPNPSLVSSLVLTLISTKYILFVWQNPSQADCCIANKVSMKNLWSQLEWKRMRYTCVDETRQICLAIYPRITMRGPCFNNPRVVVQLFHSLSPLCVRPIVSVDYWKCSSQLFRIFVLELWFISGTIDVRYKILSRRSLGL